MGENVQKAGVKKYDKCIIHIELFGSVDMLTAKVINNNDFFQIHLDVLGVHIMFK